MSYHFQHCIADLKRRSGISIKSFSSALPGTWWPFLLLFNVCFMYHWLRWAMAARVCLCINILDDTKNTKKITDFRFHIPLYSLVCESLLYATEILFYFFESLLLEVTGRDWCHGADRLAPCTWSLSGWDSMLMELGGAIEEDFKTQAVQCWLVQDGHDVHKLPTWIEGWCSMKTKRHLLAYQLHGKRWHFPFWLCMAEFKREKITVLAQK